MRRLPRWLLIALAGLAGFALILGAAVVAGRGEPAPTVEPTLLNPGYRPSAGPGARPFAEPRTSRPPVQPPDATPAQTWPERESSTDLTGWRDVVNPEGGGYRIPSGWTHKEGVVVGYETMNSIVAGGVASFDRDGQCQGDDWGYVLILPRIEGGTAATIAEYSVTLFAQARNTEYEGDFYDVPVPVSTPFTFADGAAGALSTVSFVPMYPDDYSCNTPAIRFTAVTREAGGAAHTMLAVSHIGEAGSLSAAAEQEILATFTAPGR